MKRRFGLCALSTLALVVGCSSSPDDGGGSGTGGSDAAGGGAGAAGSGTGGSAHAGSAGRGGTQSGGHAGTSGGSGGTPGAGGGGHAGSTAGGASGSSVGGSAGTHAGGSAGAHSGGSAGSTAGGSAGTGTGGSATGGSAGSSAGGSAGSDAGGSAGSDAGGSAGTSAGGSAGFSTGGSAGAGGDGGSSAGGAAGSAGAGGAAGSMAAGGAAGGAGGGLGGAGGSSGSTSTGGAAGTGGSAITGFSVRAGDGSGSQGYGIAADAQGNLLSVGILVGKADFGGGPLTSAGIGDAYVTKHTSQGVHVWSKRFGDAKQQVARDIAVDDAGNAYVVGVFGGTLDFGAKGPMTSVSSQDAFAVKLDPDGNELWHHQISPDMSAGATGVALDPKTGNVAVVGTFNGTVNLGAGNVTAQDADAFLLLLDKDGGYVRATTYGTTGSQVIARAAFDASSNIMLVGTFDTGLDFGGGSLTPTGTQDFFVAKLDDKGKQVFAKPFGQGNNYDTIRVAADPSGNMLVGGSLVGTIDLGTKKLVGTGSEDVFVIRIDPTGIILHGANYGNGAEQQLSSIRSDGKGGYLLVGEFGGTLDFGGGSVLKSTGANDVFAVKLDATDTVTYAGSWGDKVEQYAVAGCLDSQGAIGMTGFFFGTLDFSFGPMVSSGNQGDVFIARVAP